MGKEKKDFFPLNYQFFDSWPDGQFGKQHFHSIAYESMITGGAIRASLRNRGPAFRPISHFVCASDERVRYKGTQVAAAKQLQRAAPN